MRAALVAIVTTVLLVGMAPSAAFAATPSLSLSSPEIEVSESVTISFDAGSSVSPLNWIGVYRDGQVPGTPSSQRDWRYVPAATGTVQWGPTDRSGWDQTPGAFAAGRYDVYLLSNDGYTVLAGPVDLNVTANAPTLSLSGSEIDVSGSVTISYDAGTSVAPLNWIGVYKDGVSKAHEVPGQVSPLDWRYVPAEDGTVQWGPSARTGWTSVAGTLGVGRYDIYLFSNDGYTVLAGPVDLNVTDDAPSLTLSSPVIDSSGSVTISYEAGPSVSSLNWIGVYRDGQVPGTVGAQNDWRYAPTATGALPWGPSARTGWTASPSGTLFGVGRYDVYLLSNDSYTVLAGPIDLNVTEPNADLPSLSVSDSAIEVSESVSISYDAGPSVSSSNWIGVYPHGQIPGKAGSQKDWLYAPAATGTVQWDSLSRSGWAKSVPASLGMGTYDVYLFSNDGYTVLAGPVQLEVTALSPKPVTEGASELSVMSFNIANGAREVAYGPSVAGDIVREVDADVVFTPEKGAVTEAIARNLGYSYADVTDTGVISRYPIISVAAVGKDWTRAVIDVNGVETVAYGGHLEACWYANYLPRGYGACALHGSYPAQWSTWDKLASGPVSNINGILQVTHDSGRPELAALVLADAEKQRALGRLVVLGGDFNEPSAQDWVASTANLFDHHGTVVPWATTQTLIDGGMVDSYREEHPNPVTHPGFTWGIGNPLFQGYPGLAQDADERDRIDFVFYAPDERIVLEESIIVGPPGTSVRGQATPADSSDPITTPAATWLSDHKAVLSRFSVCAGGCED